MAIETFAVPLLGGGIRNDLMSQLINPNEAWDSLNEDCSLVEGASSKRKGLKLVSALASSTSTNPIRCIFDGELWDRKKIIVAGDKIYQYTPPSTFTEITSAFEGDATDFVSVRLYRDLSLGRIFVFFDGINQPLYWNGIDPVKSLTVGAPIAKCGIWHKSYFIFGNLRSAETLVYDTGDLALVSANKTYMNPVGAESNILVSQGTFSVPVEIPTNGAFGEVLAVYSDTKCETYTGTLRYDIMLFDEKPPSSWPGDRFPTTLVGPVGYPSPVNTTHCIFGVYSYTARCYKNTNIGAKFYSPTRSLWLAVRNNSTRVGGPLESLDISVRVIFSSSDDITYGSDIKWCDSGDITNWDISTSTSGGRLSLETSKGGDIMAMLPLDLDTFIVYKSDGSIIACYTTGSSAPIFGYKTISEGHTLVSGYAVVAYGGYHWALSSEGFLKIGASSVELVEPYGKAKLIFRNRTDDWKNAYAMVHEPTRRILVSFPRTGGSTNNGVLVFNIKTGTYDLWDGSYNVLGQMSELSTRTVADFAGVTVGELAGYTVGDPALRQTTTDIFAGDTSGNVYRFFVFKNSDQSAAISASRESGWLRPDPMFNGNCWFRSIGLEVDLLGDVDIVLQYRSDYDGDWKSTPVVNTTKGVSSKETAVIIRYINAIGRAIKVKWSNATAGKSYTIRSMYIEYEKMEEVE